MVLVFLFRNDIITNLGARVPHSIRTLENVDYIVSMRERRGPYTIQNSITTK